jgi:hypothetical protein
MAENEDMADLYVMKMQKNFVELTEEVKLFQNCIFKLEKLIEFGHYNLEDYAFSLMVLILKYRYICSGNVFKQAHDVAHYSQVLLVPKPGGKWRFCIDFLPLNLSVSASNVGYPLPLITQLLRRLGNKRFIILEKMDLNSGYYQILMDPATRHFAAFITESGIYVPNRLMFGVKCAMAKVAWPRLCYSD